MECKGSIAITTCFISLFNSSFLAHWFLVLLDDEPSSAELGAAAVFSGITTRTFPAKNGLLKAADALEIARPNSGPYLVSTTAIAVENTHNFGGGTVQPISEIAALRKGADELGVALHLDGARIWNAHVASGVGFAEYGKYFDTISVLSLIHI